MTRIRTLVHYTNPPALAGGCSVKDDTGQSDMMQTSIYYPEQMPYTYRSGQLPRKFTCHHSRLAATNQGSADHVCNPFCEGRRKKLFPISWSNHYIER